MIPTTTDIQNWFNEFNEGVFDNELPLVKMTITNTRRLLGQFYWGYNRGLGIKISGYYDAPVNDLRNTVLHEMCHLYCYCRGWVNEGHGERWKKIATYATEKTGLDITRTHDISEYKVSEKNLAKHAAIQERKNAPAILLDLDYGTHHFIVKTTMTVLASDDSTTRDCKVKTNARSYRVVISDAPLFTRWQTSRSIHRGYRIENMQYDMDVKSLLDQAVEVENLAHLFQGRYSCLGVK